MPNRINQDAESPPVQSCSPDEVSVYQNEYGRCGSAQEETLRPAVALGGSCAPRIPDYVSSETNCKGRAHCLGEAGGQAAENACEKSSQPAEGTAPAGPAWIKGRLRRSATDAPVDVQPSLSGKTGATAGEGPTHSSRITLAIAEQ